MPRNQFAYVAFLHKTEPCAHPGDRAVCERPCPFGKAGGSFSVSLLVVGRIVPPQDVHILTLRIYKYITWHGVIRDSLVAQMYRMPVMLETWVRSLGREDPLARSRLAVGDGRMDQGTFSLEVPPCITHLRHPSFCYGNSPFNVCTERNSDGGGAQSRGFEEP